jgi:hypothetical protein
MPSASADHPQTPEPAAPSPRAVSTPAPAQRQRIAARFSDRTLRSISLVMPLVVLIVWECFARLGLLSPQVSLRRAGVVRRFSADLSAGA